MLNKKYSLNLRFFDGEAGAAAPAGEGSGDINTSVAGEKEGAKVVYGKQPEEPKETQVATETNTNTPDPEARKAAYLKFKNEYKDLFGEDTQNIIDKRFKETKILKKQIDDVKPILDILGPKYGISDGDMAKLAKAVQEDTSLIEDQATEMGMTVEQYQKYRQLERENAEFKRAQQEAAEQQSRKQAYDKLLKEADDLKATYPGFDLEAELSNEKTGQDFASVLRSGASLKAAYQAVHFDDILPNAMHLAAEKQKEATAKNIQSRNTRPAENGISSQTGVIVKNDPSKFTFADIDDLVKRVASGEKISF